MDHSAGREATAQKGDQTEQRHRSRVRLSEERPADDLSANPVRRPTVVELFAGVGGFHLALDRAGFDVPWSNQWEPSTGDRQEAHDCYVRHVKAGDFQRFGRDLRGAPAGSSPFPEGGHLAVKRDIADVLDDYEAKIKARGKRAAAVVPDVDALAGGFPCQDYSVAKTLGRAHGIIGQKGVLWWQIHRLLELKLRAGRPIRWLLLENVDRLLKSPAPQRGRDFAVMLSSLADLGYEVEWRVVNAADYGFPQRRRRVFIVGRFGVSETSPHEQLLKTGTLARALSSRPRGDPPDWVPIILEDPKAVSDTFGQGLKRSPWKNAGVMRRSVDGKRSAVWTIDLDAVFEGRRQTLIDVMEPQASVDPSFFVSAEEAESIWRSLKEAKSVPRTSRLGHSYNYEEGAIAFPDPLDRPSRTILTGEGGRSASRFKHLIQLPDGRYRRLTPRELEALNGFPADWTLGMPDHRRAFMMGNALVVGVVEMVARSLLDDIRGTDLSRNVVSESGRSAPTG